MLPLVPPQWVVTILTVVFFLGLGCGVILIGAILLGYIEPIKQVSRKQKAGFGLPNITSNIPKKPSYVTVAPLPKGVGDNHLNLEVGRAFANPGVTWAVEPIITDIGTHPILFPVLRWRVLWEEINYPILQSLQKEFIEKFSQDIAGTWIYTISTNASDFLVELKANLQEIETTVTLYDPLRPTPPPPRDKRIVLFDVSLNTGMTLRAALKRLSKTKIYPSSMIFIIFNDLVPPAVRGEPWIEAGADLKFLYTVSSLARNWKEYEGIIEPLIVVRDALSGEIDWKDERATLALEKLSGASVWRS